MRQTVLILWITTIVILCQSLLADVIIMEGNRKLSPVVVAKETFEQVIYYYGMDTSQTPQKLDSRKVVRIERDKIPLDYQTAESYFESGSFQRAIEAYQNGLRNKDWTRQHCLYKIAFCYVQLNKHADAIKAYQVLLKEFPDTWYQADTAWDLAQCYQKLNQWDRAAQYYNQAKTLYPKRNLNSPRILESQYQQAFCTEKKGGAAAAIPLYQAVLKQSSRQPEINQMAQLRLASCYFQTKNEKQGKQILLQVLKEVSPDQKNLLAEIYVRLGQSFFQERKLQEALLCYMRVILIYPEEREANQAAFQGAIYCMDLLKKENPEYAARASQLRQLQQQKFRK